MLRPMRDLLDLAISAPDGAIGDLKDLYLSLIHISEPTRPY